MGLRLGAQAFGANIRSVSRKKGPEMLLILFLKGPQYKNFISKC